MISSEPPPTYSQNVADAPDDVGAPGETQILIVPHSNGVSFQKGYLGADGERAAVEGELQIKGVNSRPWGKVTILLRTVESARDSEIELAATEMTLFSATPGTSQPLPSVYPFSVPLPSDTPQCLHTPYSSILHTLTATLHPLDPTQAHISHSVMVHTRRYTSHLYTMSVAPETKRLEEPTKVEVEVPRTTFRTGEPIPLYLTVPPPRRELVLDEGIRLRNVRAELVRAVALTGSSDAPSPAGDASPPRASSSAAAQKMTNGSTTESLDLRSIIGSPDGAEVVAMSGASCRLHPTRAIRVRLVLHPRQEPASAEADSSDVSTRSPELSSESGGTRCAGISQATLLHDVTFMIYVHITFMHMSSHTERICTMHIPVMIVPPAAPLPEVEEAMDTAYHKKHDRPPAKTVREDDVDAPRYYENEAGPSFASAPPPFEEREAPPPFFPPAVASSSRPPTFLESEAEIYVPEEPPADHPMRLHEQAFEGEGTLFGFAPSDQFDGYQEQQQQDRPVTPPPSMEMATLDPDVTSLATLDQSAALNALGLALEQHQEAPPPPPPPPMDDPSDPPPSIDSDFRLPGSQHIPASPLPHVAPAFAQQDAAPAVGAPPAVSHGHAPPPYQVPHDRHQDEDEDEDGVTHPPPYVDLVPASSGP